MEVNQVMDGRTSEQQLSIMQSVFEIGAVEFTSKPSKRVTSSTACRPWRTHVVDVAEPVLTALRSQCRRV
jgi:hypothetical protein